MKRAVYGVNDWPEDGQEDFFILDIEDGESDEEAIKRARMYYGPEVECYFKEES